MRKNVQYYYNIQQKRNAGHKYPRKRYFLLNFVSKLTSKVSFNFCKLIVKKGLSFLHEKGKIGRIFE